MATHVEVVIDAIDRSAGARPPKDRGDGIIHRGEECHAETRVALFVPLGGVLELGRCVGGELITNGTPSGEPEMMAARRPRDGPGVNLATMVAPSDEMA